MPATPFSQGIPDGSQLTRPTYENQFHMVNMDNAIKFPAALPWTGIKVGDGAIGNPPSRLESGVFLSLQTQATGAGTGYGTTNPYGTNVSISHGTKFHDIAPDADGAALGMVFTPYSSSWTGDTNQKFVRGVDGVLAVGPVVNDAFDPGAFNTEAVTLLTGTIIAWIPVSLLADKTITGYAVGGTLTVLNGRPVKAASGDKEIGSILAVEPTVIKVELRLSGALPTKA